MSATVKTLLTVFGVSLVLLFVLVLLYFFLNWRASTSYSKKDAQFVFGDHISGKVSNLYYQDGFFWRSGVTLVEFDQAVDLDINSKVLYSDKDCRDFYTRNKSTKCLETIDTDQPFGNGSVSQEATKNSRLGIRYIFNKEKTKYCLSSYTG